MKPSKILPFVLLALLPAFSYTQISCTGGGNLFVYANYDGGVLNINVDLNVPNIKIGVCTYEPVTINLSGPFLNNVTEVRYAGYVSTNNNHCANSPGTTTINGAPGGAATSVNFLPTATLSNPNGWSSIVCGYSCVTTTSQGGCNTADQIKDYFEQSTGGTLVSYFTQYGCWSTTAYNLSAGGNCCSSVTPCTGTVTANAGADVNICPGGSAPLNGSGSGSIAGYQWSPGATLSDSAVANPVASPSTTTSYVLTVSDSGGCAAVDTVTVTVTQFNFGVMNFPGFCANDAPSAITGMTPPGGMWSGPGISGNTFDPAVAGAGTHFLTYTYSDGTCTDSVSFPVTVEPLPAVAFSNLPDFCTADNSHALSEGTPSGGTYSGPGVVAGAFDPGAAGAGTHTLSYSYTDNNGCQNTATQTVFVFANPSTPAISQTGADSLTSSVTGDSYEWFLNGAAHSSLGPTIGVTQPGLYTVVVWENGCPSDTSNALLWEVAAVEPGFSNSVRVFPVPADGLLTVEIDHRDFEVVLYDLRGRELMRQTGNGILRTDVAAFEPGIYLLAVVAGEMKSVRKIVVARD